MLLAIAIFLIGLILLLFGAEGLIRGASSIAVRSHITPFVVGLTIVAFGTSTPELVIALTSIYNDNPNIGVGNIIGSNIANILLVLGVAALVGTLGIGRSTMQREIPFLIAASALIFILSIDHFLLGGSATISRLNGGLLLAFFVLFLIYIYRISQEPVPFTSRLLRALEFQPKSHPYLISIGLTVAGLTGLIFGAQFMVEGSVTIARGLGISELVIGLTIVAVGTSLPELATTVVAVFKRKSDLAIGNIVGSNLFNILWVVGLTSVITPLAVSSSLLINIAIATLAAVMLLVVLVLNKDHQITRKGGIVLLLSYAAYVGYLAITN